MKWDKKLRISSEYAHLELLLTKLRILCKNIHPNGITKKQKLIFSLFHDSMKNIIHLIKTFEFSLQNLLRWLKNICPFYSPFISYIRLSNGFATSTLATFTPFAFKNILYQNN